MAYEFGITFIKGLKVLLAFGIPAALAIAMQLDPTLSSLTVGTIAMMVLNWAKNK